MAGLDYKSAGVNRAGADALVDRIVGLAARTRRPEVRASIGGYASLFAMSKNELLAASTDGVGTKLKLAFELGEHRTVGIDLVAMSVNDLLCVGAEPLFFLDYLATGSLDNKQAEQVLEGVVEGCTQARCALVGGETAEMPGFYGPGEYDLAGFAVGRVSTKSVLPRPSKIRAGDRLIGIGSSGLHSNGFSLFRKWVDSQAFSSSERRSWLQEALTPTRIYVKPVLELLKKFPKDVLGLAHITGSGFLNIPRVCETLDYAVTLPPMSERAAIYSKLFSRFKLGLNERAQTWNCGVGMVIVVSKASAPRVLRALKTACKGWGVWDLGEVTARPRAERNRPARVRMQDGMERVDLFYS